MEGVTRVVRPGVPRGTLRVPPAKSELMRAVLIGTLAEGVTTLDATDLCDDVKIALTAVESCGVQVDRTAENAVIIRGGRWKRADNLSAGESAFALRTLPFLAGFQGLTGNVRKEGSLRNRPQDSLYGVMDAVGMLHNATREEVFFGYMLPKPPYHFSLPLVDTSQPISGVLMAAPLLESDVRIAVRGVPSGGYVEMTLAMMARYGVGVRREGQDVFVVEKGARYCACSLRPGGDWSAASVFLAMAAHGGEIVVTNLEKNSLQPDCAMLIALSKAGVFFEWHQCGELVVGSRNGRPGGFAFDATDCPDLVPALVVLALKAVGVSRIKGASRLRAKESDRARVLAEEITKLGGKVRIDGDEILVEGVAALAGGAEVDSHGDHRMAMTFGVAGLLCERPIRVAGSEAVGKSYPGFWKDLESMVSRAS